MGTLPPPRFTVREFKERDVDFCYGSRDGQLWPILNTIYDLGLDFERTEDAVAQRKRFLEREGIGICDIVDSAMREKIDASDLGMKDVVLRDMINILSQHPTVDTLLFMGGNSKNGPEYFFRRILKEHKIELETISNEVPRKYSFQHPTTNKSIQTVSLTAPSGAANRAVGSLQLYKDRKNKNPKYNTLDFRIDQYREVFKG